MRMALEILDSVEGTAAAHLDLAIARVEDALAINEVRLACEPLYRELEAAWSIESFPGPVTIADPER
jgi:hypothetical protein